MRGKILLFLQVKNFLLSRIEKKPNFIAINYYKV